MIIFYEAMEPFCLVKSTNLQRWIFKEISREADGGLSRINPERLLINLETFIEIISQTSIFLKYVKSERRR